MLNQFSVNFSLLSFFSCQVSSVFWSLVSNYESFSVFQSLVFLQISFQFQFSFYSLDFSSKLSVLFVVFRLNSMFQPCLTLKSGGAQICKLGQNLYRATAGLVMPSELNLIWLNVQFILGLVVFIQTKKCTQKFHGLRQDIFK